jgi:hypothetical protein
MLIAMALHHPGAHLHNIWIALVTALACGIMGYLLGHIPGLQVFAGGAIIFCLIALIVAAVQLFSIF